MKNIYFSCLKLLLTGTFFILCCVSASAQINFGQSELNFNGNGNVNSGVTSLMYGPDGRLYVAEYPGTIKIFDIQRNGLNDYIVLGTETLTGVTDIVNHDDNGGPCSGTPGDCNSREVTGLTVAGTASNPIIYVTSSDFRIGAGTNGGNGDQDLDTNSGIITRFTFNGTSWDVVDLVRGLPRSEENHAPNGLEFATIGGIDYLIVAQGGHTNAGMPSTNFALICEYALSGAILAVNLNALEAMTIQTDGNGRDYIYDLPTLDDPTRANANGVADPNTAGYDGVDVNDPFGGNDGLNQAILDPTGPVQIFSPGFRNAYDLVLTESGAMYVTDNGANGGWGGLPFNEGGGTVTNNYDPSEPGSSSPTPDGEQINNLDHLQLVTTDIQNYTFNSFYGGHPNPTRANPTGAGLYTDDGTNGGVFRTQIYDPNGSTPGSTTNPAIGLPANWALVVPSANPVEGDWRGPNVNNPDGPNDPIITGWGTNTNGIDEYTASNFGGTMTGNLIAGVHNGVLRRVELNPDGSLANLTANFLEGIGGNSLGITCNSDTDPFPGSIWVGTLNGKIVVMEPADAVNCIDPSEPGYDPQADYDLDGYTNQDEEDNGTDPCNGGSQPADFDKSAGTPLVSDLNDTDDDNDGILDQDDPMQLGNPATGGSDAFELPIRNGLFNDQQGLGGIFGLGMTGLMNNGAPNPNWLNWIDEVGQGPNPDDILGGATGLMTSQMTSGTANGTTNTQEKGYQYGVQVDQTTEVFTVSGNLINFDGALQLYGNTTAVGGELGLFIGDGTQSNFIKFVITTNGLTALQEINDTPQAPININIAVPNRPDEIILYFVVNPVSGQVILEYSLDGGARLAAGSITAQGSVLNAIQQANNELMVGFIGTSNTAGVELEGTWDFLNVVGSTPTAQAELPDITRFVSSPDETIDLDNFFDDDNGDANLTYTVEVNTNPAVGASVAGNILTLTYPAAPTVSDITIRATDGDSNFVEQMFTVTVSDGPIVLYRVNAGGPTIAAIDGELEWGQDTNVNPSQYLIQAGSGSTGSFGMNSYTPEVNQATTPVSIFDTERYDANGGPPNMTYSFPVGQPGVYEVRIYMGNGFNGTNDAGERIFDISIEGTIYPLLDDVDLSGTYGHKVGTVITHGLNVTDGSIDISFLHGLIENPLLNGIEILDVSDNDTPIYVYPIASQTSNVGEQLNGSLGVNAIGGDGNFNYSAQGLPPGIFIEPTNGQIGGTIDLGADANSPYSVTITVDDSDAINTDAVTINFIWNIVDPTSYRINAGGAEVTATDNGPNWRFNGTQGTYIGGIYSVNTGLITNSALLYEDRDSSIPAYIDGQVYAALFAQERYDVANAPEMEFLVPLANGDYVVNIYVGNGFNGTNDIGERIFDISLEGTVVENDLDLIAQFGHKVGGMLSYPITLTDGQLNILFLHMVENPLLNAIEIYEVDNSNPTLTLDAIVNQSSDVDDVVNLATNATGGDPNESNTFYIAGQPDGITIDANTGVISGTIASSASVGGPDNNGIHSVVVTVTKPGSAPSSQVFTWSISQAWVSKDENENYTARHENSFVQAGDKFYLMGGRENSQTIDIYDYTTDSWNALVGSAPQPFNHFQATEYQGLIWVIGAFQTNVFPNEVPAEFIWIFDPANQVWIQGPQIPANRRRGSAGLSLFNNKFYITGGNTDGHDGGYVPWFDEYDPATGIWTSLTDAPNARDHFTTVVIGDNLYAAGGRLSGGPGDTYAPTIPEVDVYNFTSGTWSTLPSGQNIPTERAGASAVNYNDRLVVIGGETPTAGPSLTTTEEYDPVAQSWRALADLNFPRHGTQAIVSGNGIFILGGSPVQGGGNQKNMEYFGVDAPVGTPSMASTVSAPGGVQISDGTTEDIVVAIEDGNVGVFVTSMALSGPNAADFNIVAGELTDQLLNTNSTHTISVELTGVGPDRNAVLTINYGDGSSIDIILSNSNLPPDVTNPGDQFNNEGDAVSLQIEAQDASTNLVYSATGLPPDLVINPSTGLISGVIADGTGNIFLEENGLVVIEAESGNLVPTWAVTTTGGATGIIAGSDNFNNQNGGTIPYQINITTPGVYRFNWRNFYSGTTSTDQNDNWVRFPNNNGVWYFGYQGTPPNEAFLINELEGAQNNIVFPVGSGRESAATGPEGASSNGYLKIYRTGGASQAYDWQAKTSDNDAHDIYVRFENAGTYTMEISERSAGHAIDKVALYRVDGPNFSDAQLTAAPESQTSGGSGAAANSPYSVEITVTDDGVPPLDSQVQFNWIIGDGTNESPVAVASATPLDGDAPLQVTFTGSNSTDDGAIVSYLWDFMDGFTSDEADPIHTFTEVGTYVVQLTVTDDFGFNDTTTITITVNDPEGNQPPVAVASATPLTGDAPLEVTFTGSNSTDDVGVVTYFWDFKDGNTSSSADPEHTFTAPGTYDVELTVTDAGALSDTTTITITVTSDGNQPPVAVAEATPLNGNAPLDVAFTGSNSTDDVGVVSYLWDFMDGGNTSTEADPTYTFATIGSYDVTLTVTDAGGLTDTETITITVTDPNGNQAPEAVAEATPLTGNAPLEVTFTGSNSTDDVGVVSYLWDFMDGGNTSTEADPTYTFTTAGTYNVTLTVEDAEGLADTATITIVVTDGGNMPPVAVAIANPTTGAAPLSVIFNGENSFDDTGITSYLWNFDNGLTSTDVNPSYTFTADGTYNVTLTVTDTGGLTDTATVSIVVGAASNLPPVAVIEANPTNGNAPLVVDFIGRNSMDDFGVVSYTWNFGGGNTSTEVDPSFTFTTTGVYTVVLTVVDAEGLSNSAIVTITVGSVENNMIAILLENPSQNGVARIQLLNPPPNAIMMAISVHDYSGRLISYVNAQEAFVVGGTYEVNVSQLGDGLYFLGLHMSQGDIIPLKLLVKN